MKPGRGGAANPLEREALETFADEAERRLAVLDRRVAEFGRLGDREAAAELVNALFRELHSLKGAASVLRLGPIAEVAHKLEDVLDLVRQGRLRADDSSRMLLTAGFRTLHSLVDRATTVRALDVSRELARIDQVVFRCLQMQQESSPAP